VGAVDCEENQELCAEHGVGSFPTIKIFMAGGRGVGEHAGANTAKGLYEFAMEHLPSEVVNLRTKKHLDEFKGGACKEASSGCCAVLLTDKYETSPVLKSLSTQYHGVIAVGEARASNKVIGAEYGVDKFPTMVMECDGQPTVYDGELRADPLAEYFAKHGKRKAKK